MDYDYLKELNDIYKRLRRPDYEEEEDGWKLDSRIYENFKETNNLSDKEMLERGFYK